ncbi:hypothetical protein BO99DRAFT_409037 [Aspergillus violaceofuscus CBS 115571]|uniref:FAD-binding domain-containing protein n=1 Tax=Aspergillus violaceofuscus (strain CBS 115571) TaxID=1450538 RepID=A0A2V5HHZ3_ASPV1|nr:hypothetical protein BO99DRAFT_409037 [Aspergillus violaceofuscus CBS 115571]
MGEKAIIPKCSPGATIVRPFQIFESSRFATELGAAIHLPPGANGILRRYGITSEDFDCIDVQHTLPNSKATVYDSQGTVNSTKDLRGLRSLYPYVKSTTSCPSPPPDIMTDPGTKPWQFAHRVDLHEALKSTATSPEGPGTPATIHLRSKVVSCDPAAPSLTLADGSVVEGDLVIGADGVHSTLRSIIAQEDGSPHPSGGSAFRFLIPVAAIDANPATKDLVPRPGEFQLWDGTYRRWVIYPCRYIYKQYPPRRKGYGNGTKMNFVCLHPDAESQHSTEVCIRDLDTDEPPTTGWDVSGSQDQLLKIYDEFSPAMKALLAMTDPDSIKLWRL